MNLIETRSLTTSSCSARNILDDVEQMLEAHIDSGLDCTVAGIRVPRKDASAFGIIDAGADNKIRRFLEKPADPPGLTDSPEESFASMGNYIFTKAAFEEALRSDAAQDDSKHDMGGNIIPAFVAAGSAQVLRLSRRTRFRCHEGQEPLA
jgi:glucose-1-phosphate adenylyltransferase